MGATQIAVVALAACVALAAATPLPRAPCGYESCPVPKPDMMNVHLIPHTHDDVGWLKTVDQYFYGRLNNIQEAGVQYIIDSVVSELPKDPSRKFIYVETAYLHQWWERQPESIRTKVKGLIESGQLEIISGGWAMHDEAVTHYHSIIDQFTWGFKTLDEMFGSTCARPHIGWQVDPFGHARETASLMAMMGFDALFFARLDEADKQNRYTNKEMELVWKASKNHGGSSYMFTSIFHDFYYPPSGYCFDILCRDDPMIDDERSPDYNIKARVDGFIAYIERQSKYFTTNNILVPMGTDFSYQQAGYWYTNLDKLIKYVNERQELEDVKINLMYSTPSCYMKAVHDAGVPFKAKDDDFFPYSSDENSYWTGYFTSRPTQKFMERKGNNFLQVCKQLSVLGNLTEERWEELASLREAMGIMQHHDAITGTEKQHVADDYALRMNIAMTHCQNTTERALNNLIVKEEAPAADALEFKSCLLSNASICDVSEQSDRFLVTLYNPQSQSTSMFVRLPVPDFAYDVHDGEGAKLETQMIKIPAHVLNIPLRESIATQELVFQATNIPSLGYKSYYVTKGQALAAPSPVPDTYVINNGKMELTYSSDLHRLESIKYIDSDTTYQINQEYYYYEGIQGNNGEPKNRSSGAYIFRPINHQRIPISSDPPTLEAYPGALVSEIHLVFNEWVSQVTRIFKDQEEVEVEWVVGSIPIDDGASKEVISVFRVNDWQTNERFYTDSNGRETLERVKNFRPTWDFDSSFEPIAGNYYPITTSISVRNFATGSENQEFAVVTDRAQGGSSIENGEIEIMLHRRLLADDDKGVGEALNEKVCIDATTCFGLTARGKHLIFFGDSKTSPTSIYKQRKLARNNMVLYPWVFLTPTSMSQDNWRTTYNTEYTGLRVELSDNVNILTLEPWGGDNVLVRVEHFLESEDDPQLSVPATLPLMGLVDRINSRMTITERTLGGNQILTQNNRLEFMVEGEETRISQQLPRPDATESFDSITLNPMQIRTFVVSTSGAFAVGPVGLLLLVAATILKLFA